MKIEQIYTGCLAQGAYYITSAGEAAIIDPLRETEPYIHRLEMDQVQLKYIFETHFHADFVSGHIDLARKTGASIVYGPQANCGFGCISALDGEEFCVGEVLFKVLHTPGHTLESTTFLLKDENRKDHCIFSGDTLFLGDVGRPDLAQKASGLTKEELAGFLYDSLVAKILPLADEVIVYPGHGEGSACGKKMSHETFDSLGHQKMVNYALRQPNREAFINAVTEGLLPPPGYFGMNVALNRGGYPAFEDVMKKGLHPLNPREFEWISKEKEALVLDTRPSDEFALSFIPGSINIGLNGDFAPWVGALIADVNQPLLLITDKGRTQEVITRLSRVGFDHVLGYLYGGFNEWLTDGNPVDKINRIKPDHFVRDWQKSKDIVIDVRKESEYAEQHLECTINRPLAYIYDWINEIDPSVHLYIYCGSGYRSVIASSILKARGISNFTEVQGGIISISKIVLPASILNDQRYFAHT